MSLPNLLIKHSLPTVLRRIDNFVFPPLCIVCDEPRTGTNRWFCESCSRKLLKQLVTRISCPYCAQNQTWRTCSCTVAWDFPFERIVSLLDYNELVQPLLQHIKYQGKRQLAFDLGQLVAPFVASKLLSSMDLAIPIPLHWLRFSQRGYNQATEFARGLLAQHNLPLVTSILRRIHHSKTQTKLDRSDRQGNVAGIFSLVKKHTYLIAEKSVLLIDDVVTTGATTSVAAEILLNGGCKRVVVLSLARD